MNYRRAESPGRRNELLSENLSASFKIGLVESKCGQLCAWMCICMCRQCHPDIFKAAQSSAQVIGVRPPTTNGRFLAPRNWVLTTNHEDTKLRTHPPPIYYRHPRNVDVKQGQSAKQNPRGSPPGGCLSPSQQGKLPLGLEEHIHQSDCSLTDKLGNCQVLVDQLAVLRNFRRLG